MSDKRYPTRMHEVLGVEMNEEFYSEDKMLLRVNHHGRIERKTDTHPCGWDLMCNTRRVEDCINHGITRRPRLTEEQVRRLRALIALEAMYLAKNKDGSVGAFINKPTKNALYWNTNDSYVFYLSIVGTCLSELVSWEDPEPLDIVQTLREAGVEVEG